LKVWRRWGENPRETKKASNTYGVRGLNKLVGRRGIEPRTC
jgi:hypothetical protein